MIALAKSLSSLDSRAVFTKTGTQSINAGLSEEDECHVCNILQRASFNSRGLSQPQVYLSLHDLLI